MTADKKGRGVPDDQMPARLAELLAFQKANPDWENGSAWLGGLVYLDDEYFDGDSEAARQFVFFGSGPDGSFYGLWLYPGRTLETAPVVFLSSDGGDSSVLASSLDDFLALLSLGTDELGHQVPDGEITPEDMLEPGEEPLAGQSEFRDWLQQRGIQLPAEPLDLVRRARSAHPDLELWIREWQGRRYGSEGEAKKSSGWSRLWRRIFH